MYESLYSNFNYLNTNRCSAFLSNKNVFINKTRPSASVRKWAGHTRSHICALCVAAAACLKLITRVQFGGTINISLIYLFIFCYKYYYIYWTQLFFHVCWQVKIIYIKVHKKGLILKKSVY